MTIDLSFWANAITIIAGVIAIIGFIIAYVQYRSSVKTKRAEFLMKLYEKFFEDEHLKVIRERLDYDANDYDKSKMLIEFFKDEANETKLADYLNFFQFISNLIKWEQITHEEVKDMFGYYIMKIHTNPFIQQYLYNNSYKIDNLYPEKYFIFVYGKLLNFKAVPEINDICDNLEFEDDDTISGELIKITLDGEEYQALILNGKNEISGKILRITKNHTKTLKKLDDYEGYNAYDPDNSPYLRIRVESDNPKFRKYWVYVLNERYKQVEDK